MKKVYSSDLKLQLVKEYFNSEKFLKEFSDEYSIPINTLSQWVQKYKKSNYDDSVLKTKKERCFSSLQRIYVLLS
jgi:transposase-like protein